MRVKSKKKDNYRSITHRECPYTFSNGRVHEHVYVWWKHNKDSPILENEVIHHKNGNILDNRIENLEKITRSKHSKIHKEGKISNYHKSKFYFTIYNKLKNGNYPRKIAKELGFSKQKINYYIAFLKRKKIIKKGNGLGNWEILKNLSEKGMLNELKVDSKKIFSLGSGQKPTTNLHAFQINFPILEGKLKDSDWDIKEKLKNWIPKYKGLINLGGLTLKNNNNKSITIFAHARDLESLSEVHNLAFKIRAFVGDYFKKKHGVILDLFNCKTTNLNLATQDKAAEDMISKGERFELDLEKTAEKIFKRDNMKGKAWMDGSPFKFSAETNDLEWRRNYLKMPFMTRDIMQAVHYIAQNYASHVKMVEKGSKVFEMLDRKLAVGKRRKVKILEDEQTKLGDFI